MKKLFYLLLLFSVFACKKDCCQDPSNPDCENYDPCHGKKTINTYFKVRSGDNGFPSPPKWCLDKIVYSDTIILSSIRLKVPEGNENSTYEWKISADTTLRTSDEFEISFYDDLKQNGWERSFPVTLTIRTPLSNCLSNPADTLISVTRNIFFTQKQIYIYSKQKGGKRFKGHFASDPNKEVILKTLWNETFNFRGETPGHWLIMGLPIADTLMLPEGGCGYKSGCGSYNQGLVKWERTTICPWVELTKYITDQEFKPDYKTGGFTIRYQSTVPGHEFNIEFTGKEI